MLFYTRIRLRIAFNIEIPKSTFQVGRLQTRELDITAVYRERGWMRLRAGEASMWVRGGRFPVDRWQRGGHIGKYRLERNSKGGPEKITHIISRATAASRQKVALRPKESGAIFILPFFTLELYWKPPRLMAANSSCQRGDIFGLLFQPLATAQLINAFLMLHLALESLPRLHFFTPHSLHPPFPLRSLRQSRSSRVALYERNRSGFSTTNPSTESGKCN